MKKFLHLPTFILLYQLTSAQCFTSIPSNAVVVTSTTTDHGGFTPYWVCGPDTFISNGGIRKVILMPGAVMTTGGGIDTIIVKNGAHLHMNGGIHRIYYENPADLFISGGIPYYYYCPNMLINYNSAPSGGCGPSCSIGISLSPSGPAHLCPGDSLSLTSSVISNQGPVQYMWSDGSNGPNTVAYPAGNDTLLVVDSAGCAARAIAYITGPPYPHPAIQYIGDSVICPGDTVWMQADSGYSNYSWSNGDTNQLAAFNWGGVYSVSVTDSFGCNFQSDSLEVFYPALQNVIIMPSAASLCPDSSVWLSASGPDSLLWTPGGSYGDSLFLSPATNTQVIVSAVDSNGCNVADTVLVMVNSIPAQPTISQNGTTLTAAPSGSSWQWFLNGIPISGANSQSFTFSQDGNYTVMYYDANGCPSSLSAPFIITGIADDAESLIRFWPNPAAGDHLNIYLPENRQGGGELGFMNLHAQLLMVVRLSPGNNIISISKLPPGSYFLTMDGNVVGKMMR